MRDPQFCAEIMGQMRKNAGDIATKLTGDQCFAEEGERRAQDWSNLGALAATAQVASGVGGLAAEARAAAKEGKSVYGYRAVSKAEAKDIKNNGIRPDPSGMSMQDKWFSETKKGADKFRKMYPDLEEVVRAKVPRDVYDRSYRHPNIDGTGPGFCVQCSDLPLISVE